MIVEKLIKLTGIPKPYIKLLVGQLDELEPQEIMEALDSEEVEKVIKRSKDMTKEARCILIRDAILSVCR